MLIPQYQVLVLKWSPIYMVSLNTVFSIPQNQCYPGTPCISGSGFPGFLFTLWRLLDASTTDCATVFNMAEFYCHIYE